MIMVLLERDFKEKEFGMRKLTKKWGVPLLATFLLCFALTAITEASDYWPPKKKGGGGSYSVAEPAAVVLLGAGLVSLGLYAKRKRNKKD
jgi:hypothetical protein